MNSLKEIIIEGRIPHFSMIRKVLLLLSLLPLPLYFLTNIRFGEFGEYGWKILIAIMLIRPLADVFSKIKILHSLVPLRKEFGIMSALFVIIHSYAFFELKDLNILTSLFNPKYWALDKAITWGILGFLAALILLITSNELSVRLLRNNWKRIQLLAYPLFFFSAIHIALLNKDEMFEVIAPVAVVIVLWLVAHFKTKPQHE